MSGTQSWTSTTDATRRQLVGAASAWRFLLFLGRTRTARVIVDSSVEWSDDGTPYCSCIYV